jgi:hypothetical protein
MTVDTQRSVRRRRAVISMTILTLRHNAPVVENLLAVTVIVRRIFSKGVAQPTNPVRCLHMMAITAHPVTILQSVLLMGECYGFAVATIKCYCFGIRRKPVTVATRLSVRRRRAVISMTILTLRHDAPVVHLLVTQPLSICSAGVAIPARPFSFIMVMTIKAFPLIVIIGVFHMCEYHRAIAGTTGKDDCFGIVRELMAVATRVSVRSKIASFTKMTVLTLRHDAPVVCILGTQLFSILSGGMALPARPV